MMVASKDFLFLHFHNSCWDKEICTNCVAYNLWITLPGNIPRSYYEFSFIWWPHAVNIILICTAHIAPDTLKFSDISDNASKRHI